MMFQTKLILLVLIIVFGLNSCTNKSDYRLLQTDQNITGKTVTDRSIEYIILPQDRLNIALYKDPQQNTEVSSGTLGQPMIPDGVLVDTQGYVPLPLIGKVKVAGLTQTQAADRITNEYRKYLNTPSVYLEVLNKRLFVLGEVKNPGVVKLDKEKMTLFEAIAFAGDLTDDAVRENIIILSNNHQGMQMRSVNLTDFDTMRVASLMLRPNDIVYVQPDRWKEYKVASDNFTAPFETITKIAAPFVTLKYLDNN